MPNYIDVNLSSVLKQFDKNGDGKIDKAEAKVFISEDSWDRAVQNSSKINVNKKIDNPVVQGSTNDCGLISSLTSLSFTPKGRSIFSQSINLANSKKGNYEVTLGGDKYNVTAEEIKHVRFLQELSSCVDWQFDKYGSESKTKKLQNKLNQYSQGDDDALLVELAENKRHNLIGINLGSQATDYFSDFSKNTDSTFLNSSMNKELDEFQKNPNKYALICGTGSFGGGIAKDKESNDNITIEDRHFYSVKCVTKDSVTIVNPWNSSTQITITRESFMKTFGPGVMGRVTL